MSFLDDPNIQIYGKIRSLVSSINNYSENWASNEPTQGWSPNGSHHCIVEEGKVVSTSLSDNDDVIVGGKITSPPVFSPAKMVDLDPIRQNKTQIWGMCWEFSDALGISRLKGVLNDAVLRDIFIRKQSPKLDRFGGGFLAWIDIKEWYVDDLPEGSVLKKLKNLSPDKLSVRFVMSEYDSDQVLPNGETNPNFGVCKFHAVVGPFLNGDLRSVGAYRSLIGLEQRTDGRFSRNNSIINWKISSDSLLSLDISNGLMFGSNGQHIADEIYLLSRGEREEFEEIIRLPIERSDDAYFIQADIDMEIAQKLNNAPVAALVMSNKVQVGFFYDWGMRIDTPDIGFRLSPGEEFKIDLIAYLKGRPIEGVEFDFEIIDSVNDGVYLSAAEIPSSNADGQSSVTVLAGIPPEFSNRFPNGVQNTLAIRASMDDFSAFIEVDIVILAGSEPIANPTWSDVKPWLAPYGRLYTSMAYLGLDKYESFQNLRVRQRILSVIERDQFDPSYMPVTRDLSKQRIQTLINWLSNGAPE